MIKYKKHVRGDFVLNFAVVDDERVFANQLEQELLNIGNELKQKVEISVFYSGEELKHSLEKNELYQIVFLDIEMENLNGIEISRFIREDMQDNSTQIVFVSGKNGYDRQLFEFQPFYFLPKPVSRDLLNRIIAKYLQIFGQQQDYFTYKHGHGIYSVKYSDIVYFESMDRKVRILTIYGDEIFYGSIREIMANLEGSVFFSPHNSFVVNYRKVKAFRPNQLLMVNGDVIPIAKGRRKDVACLQLKMEGYVN